MKRKSTFHHKNVQGFKFGSQPVGAPRMFSHIYFIDGLLIDTGHSNMTHEVVDTISQLSVEQIFITHHHEDHTGNLSELQDHFKCPTYASSLCAEIMMSPPSISPAQWLIWGKAKPNSNIQPENVAVKTPNHTLELFPIPGHAEDMMCLYERNEGWLFSADLWVSEYIKYFMKSESMTQQIDSIKRVLELEFDVMFCSHNPQFSQGKEKMRKKLQFLEDFYGKVAKLYGEGNNASSILNKMGLKEKWGTRLLSLGHLSTINMIKSVIRDENGRV